MNVQDRATALWHIDPHGRPADIEQRNGRVLRQGNQNPAVAICHLIQEGSGDALSYQGLERKQRMIRSVLTNQNTTRTLAAPDGDEINFGDIKALATGDPKVLELLRAKRTLGELEIGHRSWQRRITRAKGNIPKFTAQDCNQPVEPDTVGAHTIIDWSDLGPTIGERANPLKPNTIARVKRGLAAMAGFPLAVLRNGRLDGLYTLEQLAQAEGDLYRTIITAAAGNTYERPGSTCRTRNIDQQLWAQTGTLEHAMVAQPLTIEMKGGGSKTSGQKSVADPMGTITGGGLNKALAVPMFAKSNGGPTDTAWHPATDPIGAITGRDTTGLVSATLPLVHGNSGDRTRHISDPLAALTGSSERYMMNLHAGKIDVEDCHFRMLKPATELAPAQGFGSEYILFGTQTNIMQGVGNAVPPAMAQWLTSRAVKTFDTPTARANA